MSEITDLKSTLKKAISGLEETMAINNDSLPKILENPNNLLSQIGVYEEKRTINLNTIESNKDEINSLKNKIAQNERDIAKLEEQNDESNREKQLLLEKIQTAQNEFTETQEKIKAKKEDLELKTARLNELDDTVHNTIKEVGKFDEKLTILEAELKEELEKKENYISSFGTRVAAIKALIKFGYIKTQQLTLIKGLLPGSTVDLKSLCVGLDIPEGKAKQILRDMINQNGPLEFDEGAGTVTLKEEVGF